MRGRTLNDAFIILDEAQNTTPQQMKMFLTRFGMRSRMVICGDPKQTDLPDAAQVGPGRCGRQARRHPRASSMVRFAAADVVRHPLVGGSSKPMKGRAHDARHRHRRRRGMGQ